MSAKTLHRQEEGSTARNAMSSFQSGMMKAVKSVAAESQGTGNGWDLLDDGGKRPEKTEEATFFDIASTDKQVAEESDALDEFEDDDDLEYLRMKRLEEMKRRSKELQIMKGKGHGEYQEIVEDQFLKEVTGSKHVVCHFYHNEFESCKTFHDRFRTLAKKNSNGPNLSTSTQRSLHSLSGNWG